MGPLAILSAVSGLGSLFGRGSQKSAEARAAEAQLNVLRDRTALDRGRLDLDQKKYALDAPGQRAGNTVRGDILSTLQKPTGGHGRFDFTSMAPTLSDSTRQTGGLMARDALLQQLRGDALPLPQATPIPQAGGLEKLGGIAGFLGSLAGGLKEAGLFGGKDEDGGSIYNVAGATTMPDTLRKRVSPMLEAPR